MFFGLFKKKEWKKVKKLTFVCKHCKFTCKSCDEIYCFTCYMNDSNPCPKCGKTNSEYKKSS